MKLSNKEKVILAVFLAIVIIVAGAFLIVVPEYNKIEGNRAALDSVKNQREQLYQTLTREATIDNELKAAADKADKFANYFYDDMTTYEADAMFRQILEEGGLETKSLSISPFSTSTLTVTEYVQNFVSYPLKEYSGYADDTGIDFSQYQLNYDDEGNIVIDQALQEAMGNKIKDIAKDYMNTLLSATNQTLGSISASFTVDCTRAEYYDFVDYIHGLERATYISGASIPYTGTTNVTQNRTTVDADGNEITVRVETSEDGPIADDVVTSYNISMTLFCAKELQTEVQTSAQ